MRECIYYMRTYIYIRIYILYENTHISESMWSRTLIYERMYILYENVYT
jgi:hypothetical protein